VLHPLTENFITCKIGKKLHLWNNLSKGASVSTLNLGLLPEVGLGGIVAIFIIREFLKSWKVPSSNGGLSPKDVKLMIVELQSAINKDMQAMQDRHLVVLREISKQQVDTARALEKILERLS
jgi:hypothetical protein